MESIKIVMDTIRVALNQTSICNKVVETNQHNVAIAFIIAIAAIIALLIISVLIFLIVRMKKYEGIKSIVENILKEKKMDNAGIAAIVEKVLEEKAEQYGE